MELQLSATISSISSGRNSYGLLFVIFIFCNFIQQQFRAGRFSNSKTTPSPVRWTTFHLRWSFVCRSDVYSRISCIQNKCRPMRRLTRFLNPPKLGIEQNIVQHAFDEIGYPALRAPLRRRASSHRIALSPGLRQAPH